MGRKSACILPLFIGYCVFLTGCRIAGTAQVTDYVDVFVGTEGDHGQLYPGAALPFGLVKLSPDTQGKGHAGYDYVNTKIKGFSHTRIGGVGCRGAGGSVLIKPALGKSLIDTMDKSTEVGSPGFYGIHFENGIQAALTVSYRVGFHSYTFPASEKDRYIRIDPSQSYAGNIESTLKVNNDRLITGFTKGENVCDHKYYKLYYAVLFDQDFTQTESDGDALWCKFTASVDPTMIQIKVGLSPISIEQAVAECSQDIRGWDFQASKKKAQAKWNQTLGKVEITSVPKELEEFRDLFYTCLYRCFLLPNNVTGSTGEYKLAGDEETIRNTADTADGYVHYSGWSTWDDFRKFSLISLLEPEIAHNIARSIVEWFKGGYTPPWADGYWPCPSVRNEFIAAIVLDAYQKGLTDYDAEAAFQGMANTVLGNDQVEKPYQYYLVMKMAQLLGKDAEAREYKNKALGYQKYWCSSQVDEQGTVRGFLTLDGEPVPQDNVDEVDAYYYEGNLWHYRFFVPHDIQGLANLRGSRHKLADDLEYYFRTNQHMALNEPPLAYPFVFSYLEKPWLTQYWSRKYITETVVNRYHNHGLFEEPVVRRVYEKKPAGWLKTMDDDTGAMSSQFVYSALGLYPACMGDPYYVIGSPLFPEAVLHLEGNKKFVIRTINVSLNNPYIQFAKLNGQVYEKTWIDYKTIQQGGSLELVMGPLPNPKWASSASAVPPSLSKPTE